MTQNLYAICKGTTQLTRPLTAKEIDKRLFGIKCSLYKAVQKGFCIKVIKQPKENPDEVHKN